jgi:hypothetical protein
MDISLRGSCRLGAVFLVVAGSFFGLLIASVVASLVSCNKINYSTSQTPAVSPAPLPSSAAGASTTPDQIRSESRLPCDRLVWIG